MVYDITKGFSELKRPVWDVKSTALVEDMSTGRFVELSGGEAVKAHSAGGAVTYAQKGRVRPIWSGVDRPDGQELQKVVVPFGEHEAETDGYHEDPTSLSTARAAWAEGQALVVVDGKLAPFLDGTDKDYAILGYVVSVPSDGIIKVHLY